MHVLSMNHSSQINCHTTIRNYPRLVQWIVNASAYILSREYMLIIIVCSSVGGGLLLILVLIFILCCIYRQCSGKRKTKSFVSFASNLNFGMVSRELSQLKQRLNTYWSIYYTYTILELSYRPIQFISSKPKFERTQRHSKIYLL